METVSVRRVVSLPVSCLSPELLMPRAFINAAPFLLGSVIYDDTHTKEWLISDISGFDIGTGKLVERSHVLQAVTCTCNALNVSTGNELDMIVVSVTPKQVTLIPKVFGDTRSSNGMTGSYDIFRETRSLITKMRANTDKFDVSEMERVIKTCVAKWPRFISMTKSHRIDDGNGSTATETRYFKIDGEQYNYEVSGSDMQFTSCIDVDKTLRIGTNVKAIIKKHYTDDNVFTCSIISADTNYDYSLDVDA